MINQEFKWKQYIIITLIVSIWINISEVFRYFLFVMPSMKLHFDNIPGVAEMDLRIFSIWGVWDTLLTAILVFAFWLFAKHLGNNLETIIKSGLFVWISIFVIFWVATANMGLSNWSILLITLPLSLLEMIVGAWIASKLYQSNRWAS